MAAPLALVGLGSTIFGGVLGAQGASQAGAAQEKQNYYQAGVAELNSQIAKQNADYAMNQGEQQAQKFGMAAGEREGQIVASQASSGTDVNTGSNLGVQKSQHYVDLQDLTQIRSNAAKVAYDYDVQSVNFDKQAQLYKMAGKDAAAAGATKAEASIVGTVGSVASKWTQGSQVGLFNDLGTDISSFGKSIFGS